MTNDNAGIRLRWQRLLGRNETVLLVVLLAMMAAITTVSPRFLGAENLFSILLSASYTGIFAIGFLVVLISGGLDVSFTAVATVAQYVVGTVLIANPKFPPILAALLPLAVGISLGCLNAVLIHYLNAPPIIVTIANLNIFFGLLQFITGGEWLNGFPKWFDHFPQTFVVSFENSDGVKYGLSVIVVIWLSVALIAGILMRYFKVGRKLYAMGGNMEAARRAGIDTLLYRVFAYGFLGFCAGLGGLVHSLITQTVVPNTLVGHEFDVVAAVVLGGASIFGGSGTVGGTLLGVVLLAVLGNALTIMRVPTYWHEVFVGGIVIASIAITTMSSIAARNREKKSHANQ
jgi:simple sugar transport system permease protein